VRTLCLDFDGVLHTHNGPYEGETIIRGTPVPGAVAFVEAALGTFDAVVVHSARCRSAEGRRAITLWLTDHGFPMDLAVVADKPPAIVYLDDRAVTFTGVFPDPGALAAFLPWDRTADLAQSDMRPVGSP
jgi:hypothetical protein